MRWAISRLLLVRATMAYGVILFSVYAALAALGPSARDRVLEHASTNLHNLSHGHLGTLFVSAFVVDAGSIALWLPGLLCLLGLGELLWRSTRLIVAFLVGHVGATVLVAAGLTAAVTLDWMPAAVARVTDVGMSYGAAAVLGTFTAAIPGRWRSPWIGWWLAVGVAVITVGRDFTDVGHVVALILGAAVASRFGAPRPWTPLRVGLLLIATSFDFLVIANSLPELVAASACGVVAVVVVEAVRLGSASLDAQRNSSAEASTQSESHDCGGSSRSSPGMSHS
jgi:hypothetical protein